MKSKWISVFTFVPLAFVACCIASNIAYNTGAGDSASYQTVAIILTQMFVMMTSYIAWYAKVKNTTANAFNINDKLKKARKPTSICMLTSMVITGIFCIYPLIIVVFSLFSEESLCGFVPVCMWLVGNVLLWSLIKFIGLPND